MVPRRTREEMQQLKDEIGRRSKAGQSPMQMAQDLGVRVQVVYNLRKLLRLSKQAIPRKIDLNAETKKESLLTFEAAKWKAAYEAVKNSMNIPADPASVFVFFGPADEVSKIVRSLQ